MAEEEREQIFNLEEIPREEYISPGTKACPGCGALLGLRIVLKMMGKDVVIFSNGPCAPLIGSTIHPYYVIDKLNELPKQEKKILVYDQVANIEDLSEFVKLNEKFLLISYNNENKPLVKIMSSLNIPYVATACVSYPLDLVNKVMKALKYDKSFIHLLAPCPTKWGFDSSNTIEIGKSAVSSGFWPLYEIKEKEFSLTFRPRTLDSAKPYFESQRRFRFSEEEKNKEQERISRNWRLMQGDKFWMTK